jgi:hypothetical protein
LLELTEGLIEFVHMFWLNDEVAFATGRAMNVGMWSSLAGLIRVIKDAWRDRATSERQRAMGGLM